MNEPHSVGSITVRNHERPTLARQPEGQKPLLAFGVVRVVKGVSKRVFEDRGSLLKTDAMLFQIGGGFVRVPLKEHGWSLAILPRRKRAA